MAHYYDRNAVVEAMVDAENDLLEIRRREKIGRARQRKMKRAITSCMEKYKGLKKLYKINSNFKFANQRENDMGIARSMLMLAKMYRVSAIELDDSDEKKKKHTAKARSVCDEASEMFTLLDDQMGIAQCYSENAKVSLAFKELYPKDVHEFEENIKNLMDAREYFKKAHDIYDWLHAVKSLSVVEAQLSEIEKDLSFSRLMVKRLKVAKYGPTEDDSDNEEAEEFKQEADSIKAVFDKFDADGSGFVDMKEFHEIAASLGTFPPLTEAECYEVIRQLGKHGTDAKLSWKEFLCWWVSGSVVLKEQGVKDNL